MQTPSQHIVPSVPPLKVLSHTHTLHNKPCSDSPEVSRSKRGQEEEEGERSSPLHDSTPCCSGLPSPIPCQGP